MTKNENPQNVINSFKKRQQVLPFIIGILAVVLVVIGVVAIVMWLSGSSLPKFNLFASPTPTATNTHTPTPVTPTSTPTMIPTETLTPTMTLTLTPSGPFEYEVLQDDTCWDIAVKFDVELALLLGINNFLDCNIQPGQKILIPAPDQTMPTETPIPTGLARGTVIEYRVQLGDSLDMIASKFNTTVELLVEDNKIDETNIIFFGQVLKVKVNMVTPTPTRAASITPQGTTLPSGTTTP